MPQNFENVAETLYLQNLCPVKCLQTKLHVVLSMWQHVIYKAKEDFNLLLQMSYISNLDTVSLQSLTVSQA
jgi:hypothetical protein